MTAFDKKLHEKLSMYREHEKAAKARSRMHFVNNVKRGYVKYEKQPKSQGTHKTIEEEASIILASSYYDKKKKRKKGGPGSTYGQSNPSPPGKKKRQAPYREDFTKRELDILKRWVNHSEDSYEESEAEKKLRREAVNKLMKKAQKDSREKRALKVLIQRQKDEKLKGPGKFG